MNDYMPAYRGLNPSPPAAAGAAPANNGYTRQGANGFAKDLLLLSPPTTGPLPPAARADLKDPIQVHLLTETALSDSKHYDILAQEEVDDLKKQSQLLRQRIDSTRTNLAIQSKYRDAAVSMTKLFGSANLDDPNALEAQRESQACERRCDVLAAELFNLEKRLMAPQRRLLEHTAGILQLTHKASKKKTPQQLGQPMNGIPGSPESMYTYSLGRDSLDQNGDENTLDEGALSQFYGIQGLQINKQQTKNVIEIPLKSPIREQTYQLREEMERVREENTQLRSQTDFLIDKLQTLNVSLRETIVRFNPDVNKSYLEPPSVTSARETKQQQDLIKSQIEYIESGLVAVQAEQESSNTGDDVGERIESFNLQVRDMLMLTDPHYAPKPIPRTSDTQAQLQYLEDSLRLAEVQFAGSKAKGQAEETGPVLESLWESIQNGFAEAKKRKEERRKMRVDKGVEDDEDMSEDEAFDTSEPYTLGAFSLRIQWLQSQASTLKEQKGVLKRQIKQQRDLNNKSDADKEDELKKKQAELEQARELLAQAEKEALQAQTTLSEALADLEDTRESSRAAAVSQAEQSQQLNTKVEALETQLMQAQSSLAAAETGGKGTTQKLTGMEAQLDSLSAEKEIAEENARILRRELEKTTASLSEKEKAAKAKEEEMEQLNMTLVELKTELTIAQAELDGAYGSRAERAADAAAIKSGGEAAKLQSQVDKLKKELAATLQELETITKETIGSERERLDLEAKLDEALLAKTTLEAEAQKARENVAKLQEELDGERLKANSSLSPSGRPGAGASMLSEQFRATMREERKRFQEDLKEERARGRKLEEELSRLRRSQGPGKSPLSPR
ncbi:hypothetical protein CDD82_3469 [Ophiocordyceps australis]|uniref:Uncharacterized protein n=1 Tax=Ophiocordyceps australis TaxID=1399860 RepID=A0A2C5Z6S1_9HYPO|nr:hypothetical protein CDD82_3469 [Ophiocordyceps australis]